MRRFSLSHHLATAWESLLLHRLRTLLTTVGVVAGIASITTILALNDGLRATVQQQLDSLDGTIIVVRPETLSDNNTVIKQNSFTVSSLTQDDYESVRRLPSVVRAAPMQITYGTPRADSSTSATIVGSTPDLAAVANLRVSDGQFLDNNTVKNTAVVGQQLAIDLFGSERALGQTFTIRGIRFTVIGTLKPQEDPVNIHLVNFDTTAIIHLSMSETLTGNQQLQQITAQAARSSVLAAVHQHIDAAVAKNHQGEHDFRIVTGTDIAAPTGQLFGLIQAMLFTIASISLIVGGVGIMNISLVSVAERTREIGLRKAIGATSGTIVGQFLIEAVLISLFGAVVGLALGYGVAIIASTLLPFKPSLHWTTPLIAAGTALATGVVFGSVPAIRAARKDPIESLRHYD